MNHPISLHIANVGFLGLLLANLQGTVAVIAATTATVFYLIEILEKPTVRHFLQKLRKKHIG